MQVAGGKSQWNLGSAKAPSQIIGFDCETQTRVDPGAAPKMSVQRSAGGQSLVTPQGRAQKLRKPMVEVLVKQTVPPVQVGQVRVQLA